MNTSIQSALQERVIVDNVFRASFRVYKPNDLEVTTGEYQFAPRLKVSSECLDAEVFDNTLSKYLTDAPKPVISAGAYQELVKLSSFLQGKKDIVVGEVIRPGEQEAMDQVLLRAIRTDYGKSSLFP